MIITILKRFPRLQINKALTIPRPLTHQKSRDLKVSKMLNSKLALINPKPLHSGSTAKVLPCTKRINEGSGCVLRTSYGARWRTSKIQAE
jgi:hypothetical protein